MREVRWKGFRVNPVVFFGSIISVLVVVLIAVVNPEVFFDTATGSRRRVSREFTWLYVGSQNLWVLFMAYIYLNPDYRSVKLGSDDAKPEYNTVTWVVMMFGAAGTGTGLIYYGVAEPILHLGMNRYLATGYLSFDELSQEALNLAFFHWGIHTWVCYTIVGICMGMVTHRLGLPLCHRSCFFALFGQTIYGTVGDFVDMLSIVTTVFAVCTSMGVGAIQINTGISLIAPHIAKSPGVQATLIVIMTVVAGASVRLGLRRGVRVLSIVAFSVMSSVLVMVLMADETQYLLNLMVQSLGHHLHHFVPLSFRTDAFEQLGVDVDGKSGPKEWMDLWTTFYWGWWVSWSPFVGMFIGKISKGRTVGEVIHASLAGPVLFTLMWFAVFGGAGLRMERQALEDGCLGKCQVIYGGERFNSRFCQIVKTPTFIGANGVLTTEEDTLNKAEFAKRRPGGCSSVILPSARAIDDMWFDVLNRYDNIGGLLVVLSIVSMILSVITSNDSGAIVLNTVCCNGWSQGESKRERAAMNLQIQGWCFMLGTTTTVMTLFGKERVLQTLQTIIVAVGLPYSVLVCMMCLSARILFDMELHPATDYTRRYDHTKT